MINSSDIYQQLQNLTSTTKFVIAFSGGLDSHVLLHLLEQTPAKIRAVYINHGLQKQSDVWAVHCQKVCDDLGVPFKVISVKIAITQGESLEELARSERYQALHNSLQADEALVTAHHQNDQAETLLLQLFRGAGVEGLAAMPAIREFGPKDQRRKHLRPLLDLKREELEEYAKLHKLDYIQDPSNLDQAFDRNYLRNKIMPQLRQRWLGIDKTIARAATIQSETKQILNEVAAAELQQILFSKDNSLLIEELLKLPKSKQNLVVRYWITQSGFINPSDKKLKHIFSDVVDASEDSQPLLEWQGAQVRRFQNRLYIMEPVADHDPGTVIHWDGKKPLDLPSLGITVNPDQFPQDEQSVTVRFRQGGESIKLPKRGSISLKNLFQEQQIPPWMRSRLPLIFVEDKLVKVIGLKQ